MTYLVLQLNIYDIIYLQNVLEHVISPIDLLRDLHSILSMNGVIVLTVPNDFSVIQKEAIRRNHIDNEFWIGFPDHLSYFDKNGDKEEDKLPVVGSKDSVRDTNVINDYMKNIQKEQKIQKILNLFIHEKEFKEVIKKIIKSLTKGVQNAQ